MSLLNALKEETNYTLTENGGVTHKTTKSKVLDMFAMGGAYRSRSNEECIQLFEDALQEDTTLALKCLFYLRDIRGGQGERRFFRVCMNHLAYKHEEIARRVMKFVPEYGRWDDMYCFVGTQLQEEAFMLMKAQMQADLANKTPSLLGKWLKSENTSSKESRDLARLTRGYFHMSAKEYRKLLSYMRMKIGLVERQMSENKWSEIRYDAIPSKAGLKYRKAFERHDEERYAAFIKNQYTKVNASTLYPYEVVEKALYEVRKAADDTGRLAVNKYWDNLTDYFHNQPFNALCMVDTSGSMHGTPINVAISLGLYCAEKANGPFHNHYISFSSRPQLIETAGYDFVDKVRRIYDTNLCENTDIEAAFDLVLDTAVKHHMRQKDLPENIIVISDMEFDDAYAGLTYNWEKRSWSKGPSAETVMDSVTKKWTEAGYQVPNLIYWNVNARQNNIPQLGDRISFVSGFSPSIFQQILSGKTGYQLMLEKLLSDRYAKIV